MITLADVKLSYNDENQALSMSNYLIMVKIKSFPAHDELGTCRSMCAGHSTGEPAEGSVDNGEYRETD